ncbi:MAG: ATP-dependent helicase [Chitinophagaceae bacterium]|nr:MAG: ATP-dependent helicase [Chitinophagaceae bacterium]
MNLIDNIHSRLADDLKATIKKGSRLRIAASSFSIYAYEALKKELDGIEELQFLFTGPTFSDEGVDKETPHFYIPHIFNERMLCGGEFELRLKNQLTQRAIARECAEWVRQKVTFKSNRHADRPLHNMIHVDGRQGEAAYTNLGGFTTADLGLTHRKGFPALIHKTGTPESHAYLEWFDQVWENDQDLRNVTEKVQSWFESAYKENSPEFIYFITLYNIFSDFLEDLSQGAGPNEQLGLRETVIWDKMYDFQRDAVVGAINKLEKFKGCILADSVGLGKTFTALGVIKYYEMRNKDVLVLCPKKLEDNWNTYRHNDKTNILAADRLRYDVLFHTDLSREHGVSNGRNLAHVNWGNYGLVVIDESHNFRNNNPYLTRENRYQKLLRRVIKEGIETKVLMLSATPVNNRFNDLKNQLALAYEGDSEWIDARLDTQRGIDQVFKRAQQAFKAWSGLATEQRTTERLLDMLDFDFFELLDSLTIARSRKHITHYYDTKAIGRFPTRNSPGSEAAPLTEDNSITYVDIAERLILLNLSVYTPLNYLLPSRVQKYRDRYETEVRAGSGRFSQIDRDNSLRVLMRINLLKRLESSADSFRITLDGIISQIRNALQTIERGVADYEGTDARLNDESFDWESDWGDEEALLGRKVKVHIADIDTRRWREDLESDLGVLEPLLASIVTVYGERDHKLQRLLRLLDQKVTQPFNEGNRKAIVFTAFADTANYLYEQVSDYMLKKYGIHTALITGSRKANTTQAVPNDLSALLTCFSPLSKNKAQVFPHLRESFDLLVATDCISEGQNLQDCDYLVNYDIHWNPVRIIQRFGRIDRIGSRNESITLVNFWPDVTLDAYINLKQRVESRMLISNMASTGDDNILKSDDKDLEYRKIQLQRLRSEVVDLEELREGVSITDLGLNDFRVDLANYIKEYGEIRHLPEGLHAVVPAAADALEPGAIFVLKNVNSSVNIDKMNRLHPYYLVYIAADGTVEYGHGEPKRILDAFRLLCKGKKEPFRELCKDLSAETDDYHNMSAYSELLKQSVGSVLKTEEEKEVLSLFRSGGTTALAEKLKGIEDFKLISFLIIR